MVSLDSIYLASFPLNMNCWFGPPCLGKMMSGAPGERLPVHHDENEGVDKGG